MSSNAYDSALDSLKPVAGNSKSKINEAISKADASLNNQANSIEPNNVATAPHAKGDFIVYGSSKKYAEVTQAIAIGDSISNGTNVADKSIGEVLTTLNQALSNKVDKDATYTESSGTNITSYNTSNNRFTLPSDGYIYVSTVSGTTFVVRFSSGMAIMESGSHALFARKGTKVYCEKSGTGNAGVYFYPII